MVFVSQPGTFFLADDRLSWFPPAVLRRRVGCSSCAANLLSKRLEGAFKPNFKRGELPNTAAVTIARPQIPGPFPNAVSRSTQNLRAPPIVPLATIPRFRRPHPIGCRTREPGNLIRINRRRRGPCDIVPARTSRRDGARWWPPQRLDAIAWRCVLAGEAAGRRDRIGARPHGPGGIRLPTGFPLRA